MNLLLAPLGWMGRHGTGLSAAAIFVGLFTPDLAALVRPWLGLVVTAMLSLALVTIEPRALADALRRPRPLLAAALVTCIATPLVFAAARPVLEPLLGPGLMLGLFIFAFAPPTLSSPAFAILMGLEGAYALALCLGLTLVAPLVIPLVAGLAGVDFPVDPWRLAGRLVLIVAPAALAATALRHLLGPDTIAARRHVLTGLMIVPLVIFAIGSMDGMAARILAETDRMATILAIAIGLAVVSLVCVTAILWPFGRHLALPLGWCAGNRNLGLLVGALSGVVPPDTWSYFALAQFPIYALPAIARPFYRRLARRDAT